MAKKKAKRSMSGINSIRKHKLPPKKAKYKGQIVSGLEYEMLECFIDSVLTERLSATHKSPVVVCDEKGTLLVKVPKLKDMEDISAKKYEVSFELKLEIAHRIE